MPFTKGHTINLGRKMSKQRNDRLSLFYSKKRTTKPCLFCGISMSVSKWNSIRKKFCSKKCFNESKVGKPAWNKGLKNVYKLSTIHTNHRKGEQHHFFGKKRLEITGEKNWRWIKDRSKLKKYEGSEERRSPAYKFWRKSVWLRDNFKCKIANPDCCGRIEVHHILGWKDYPELRYKINNGITLCHAHHPRVRAEEKRLIPTFVELVSVSTE